MTGLNELAHEYHLQIVDADNVAKKRRLLSGAFRKLDSLCRNRDFKHYGPYWRLWPGGATRTITAHLSHLGLTDFADSPLGDQFVMDVCDGLGPKAFASLAYP